MISIHENQEGFPCEIVALDIGGTHARFAIAQVSKNKVLRLDESIKLKCADYDSLASAREAYGRMVGRPVPRKAGIAIACPVVGDKLKMTNNPWTIYQSKIAENLHLDDFVLVNDFAAVGHAVAALGPKHFAHLCGPKEDLPAEGRISIVGPGTGLGVALLLQPKDLPYQVLETEGGHIAYAPLDDIEGQILQIMRERLKRVSAERIVSGPGLVNIYKALGRIRNIETPPVTNDRKLWESAVDGSNALARDALERFCLSLASVAGDMVLAHGSKGLVIGGGIGFRISEYLIKSGFAERFCSKGRFKDLMASLPVKIIMHPDPGLYGAAAAYANRIV